MKTRKEIIQKRHYRSNIKGDDFSLYISSYPISVEHVVQRIKGHGDSVVELCCGLGVTLEVMANHFEKVTGVDNSNKALDYCKSNIKQARISDRVSLVYGDIFKDQVLEDLLADVVVYDIPYWSSHKEQGKGNLTKTNPPISEMVKKIRNNISSDIVIFCPPDYKYGDIKKSIGECEFERVFVNGKHDRNHIYLGSLSQKEGETEVKLSC